MANNMKRSKKRRRQQGVPTLLMIILLAIALVMGGLAGFAIARRTDPNRAELIEANARISELENTLTLIGFSTDSDTPEDWIFDDSVQDAASDLAGAYGQGESDLWADDDLLTGTLDETGDPVVVAEFNGGELLSTEVIPEYNDQLTTEILAGNSAEEVAGSLLMSVMSYMAGDKIVAQKARELGLDQLTDDDLKAIEAEADSAYNEQLNYYTAFVTEPGMTQEEALAAAASESGITREAILEELRASWPVKKYYDYLVKDITVSDAEIQSHYDETLAAQKALFTENPDEYEFAHTDGSIILYNLDGYRAVRDLLIPFEDEAAASQAADLLDQIDRLDPIADAEKAQALQAEIAPLYAPLETKAQEIVAKLRDGASFTALVDEYGADESMEAEPVRSEGYYISDGSFLFSAEFIEGSLLLETPGDVSAPLRSASGVHLAEFVSEIKPGEVPLSDVYDQIRAEALEAKQDDYYQEQTAAMLDAANVQYYPERLQ